MEIIKYRPEVVESWAQTNLDQIAARMQRQADSLRQTALDISPNEVLKFWPGARALSEMPLCRSLRDITPPEGYRLASNVSVKWFSEGNQFETYHSFYVQEGSWPVVLCLTSGQFDRPDDITLVAGDRIAALKEKGGDLIHVCSGQIAYLHGTKKEVAKKLGIYF